MKKIVIIYKDAPSCSFKFKDEATAAKFFNFVINDLDRNDIAQINIINVDIKS